MPPGWSSMAGKADPLFFAVIDRERRRRPGGVASLLRIAPEAGSIEVGHICWPPALQRTRAASEAIYLFADWVFREGYRRFEWKCDALEPAEPAGGGADGLLLRGGVPQPAVVKGRNRDTAWFAMTDGDWRCAEAGLGGLARPGELRCGGAAAAALRELTAPCRVASDPLLMAGSGAIRRWQRRWKDGWVGDLDAPGARRNAAIDMLVFDHGLLRKAWRNEHEIDGGVWRSSQPDPGAIRRLAGQGFKAVLNLRGATEYGSYLLEREACRAAGIELVDFKLTSRVAAEPGGDPGARRRLRAAAAAVPDALQVGRRPGGVRGGALPDAAARGCRRRRRSGSCPGASCTCAGRRPGCCTSCSSATRRRTRWRR